ncbi:hypothetical protein [Halobellus rubicundus]|uniref:Uncharacterized protein n=1 Tax=Halobellus rubicundus TaxID=2996466 RepID=A0ABD5MCP1_9EURY
MSLEGVIRQAYRGYGAAVIVWAGWSAVWLGTDLRMDPSVLGYGWLAIAAFGAVVGVSMASVHLRGDGLFRTEPNRRRLARFDEHRLSGAPLYAYVAALVGWAVLTGAWTAGLVAGIDAALVGYGWIAIALYGVGLTIALAVTHKRDLADAVDATVLWARGA